MREYAVRLECLPAGLTFPAELQDRVQYDARKKRLVFRGFMTKSDYDRLARLSNEFQYERCVEELFVAAGYEGAGHLPRVAVVIGGVLCLLAITAAIWYFWLRRGRESFSQVMYRGMVLRDHGTNKTPDPFFGCTIRLGGCRAHT